MKWLALVPLLIGLSPATHAEERPLHPFVTDGCTLFPEGTRRDAQLWEECCVEHDLALWMGGPRSARRAADLRLRACVKKKGGPAVATLMYLGVRAGTFSPFKLRSKKWGNAWGPRFRPRPLRVEEIQRLEVELRESGADRLISEQAISGSIRRLMKAESVQ